jgi:arylsulfatase
MRWSQNHPNAWGDPGSWLAYGPGWAQVSMTPLSQYKALMAEGGIRNALIVSGPLVQRPKGSINQQGLMHVADIMPTLLEVAGTSYPKTYNGKDVPPALGKSWVPVLEGRAESPRTDQDVLAWEVFGNRAVRQGNWKLRWQIRPFGTGEWELFDLAADPGELKDLAAERPDKVKQMVALWDDYARQNNVILPNRTVFESLEKALPQRVPVQAGYPPANLKRQYVPPANMLADPKK